MYTKTATHFNQQLTKKLHLSEEDIFGNSPLKYGEKILHEFLICITRIFND